MPVYKDKNSNDYYVSCYYTTINGQSKRKVKRGFSTKKEAKEWEHSFLLASKADMGMKVSDFIEIYFNDKKNDLKERTIKNKRYMMDCYVVPFFGNMKMNEIKPATIIAWQNEMYEKGFKPTYLRMIQNQVTALFTHATRIYNLKDNPCSKVKKMGKSDADEMSFWTKDEYDKFIATFEEGSMYHTFFELLFWTGCREGEALAITKNDINFDSNQLSITKTYYRTDRKDIITAPKTEQSIRTIELPQFLTDEIKLYLKTLYKYPNDRRIFPVVAEAVQHVMRRHIEKAGVKKIRVHDMRHSHVAYLINQGVQPLIIKERLGHKDIQITLNTYGHLYPSKQRELADMLDNKKSSADANQQSKLNDEE